MSNLKRAIHKFIDEHGDKNNVRSLWIPFESIEDLGGYIDTTPIWFERSPDDDIKKAAEAGECLIGYFTDGADKTSIYVNYDLGPNQFQFEPEPRV
jgi:hypothetical protein